MIRLFYNYYEDKNSIRKKEIDFCLQKNLENTHMTTNIIETADKPTYDYFFQRINEVTGPDDVNIICNSDIFFDDTITLTQHIKHKELWALSRWDWHAPNHIIFCNRQDSQDVWIVRGKIENVHGSFTLGIRGCDNRIAHEFLISGYHVRNPSKTVKSYHVHNSGIRNYLMRDVVSPPYHTITPTEL